MEPRALLAVDVLTYHYDNARDGQNTAEVALTPANVNTSSFGKLFSLPTDGLVYAQPLLKTGVVVPGRGTHDVLIVATENDSVYAFDASGVEPPAGYLWKDSFISPGSGVTTVPSGDVHTGDISPEIGITGTPVIDPATNTLYVVALTKEVSGSSTSYVQRLHALDLATGAEKSGGPTVISASVPGTGDGGTVDTFNPMLANQRASLALVNGVVYVAFASHGDNGPYHGWVLGYDASDIARQVAAFDDTPNGAEGGIWMAGGGISADSSGSLFVAVGNGTFDANQGGRDYGDSALRLTTGSGLAVADSFTPTDQAGLSVADLDFGVADAMLLPNQAGPHPRELITADKTGRLYLLDRDHLGGNASPDNAVAEVSIGTTLHNNLAYYNGSIYVAGDGNNLRAYSVSGGTLASLPWSESPETFGLNTANGSGGNPVVSADGYTNEIAWVLDNSGYATGAPAILHAYNAANLAQELYSSAWPSSGRDRAGSAVKFSAPVVADGMVFVPGASSVTAYGLLPTVAPPARVDLAPEYNRPSIFLDGAPFGGGLDDGGDALSAGLLGSGPSWAGVPFAVGPPGVVDVVAALGQTVALPAGRYATLDLLAAGVDGNQPNQAFTVAYADGSSTTFTRSVSDWFTPQGYPGESTALAMPYRDTSSGGRDARTFRVYGYSLPLDSTKTVVSLTLPVDPRVALIAATAVPPPTATEVDLAPEYNRPSIFLDGAPFGGGLDDGGDALSAGLLGSGPSWAGVPFAVGPPGVVDVVAALGQTVALPAGRYATLDLLAAGVDGNQPNQAFTVAYADGSSTTFTRSVSDWFTPQGYPGESTALAMPYRDTSSGGRDARTFRVYGYSLPLDSTKTVVSLTLPVDPHVALIAATLVPPSTTGVSLAGSFNQAGIVGDGSAIPAVGSLDGNGDDLSANLLGSSVSAGGATFAVGPAGAADVVAATGQAIALPAGRFGTLAILGTAVDGNQPGQAFTVTYTDGSAATFTRSISDWYTPQGYPGESDGLAMAYRDEADGTKDRRTFHLNLYRLALDPTKTVASLTLPNQPNVKLLAIDLLA